MYAPQPRGAVVGIIQDVSKEISDDELNSSRGTAPIMHTRRLGVTFTIKVVFATASVPAHVTLGYTRFKSNPLLTKSLQCKPCFQFDHSSSGCEKAITCSRSYGAHDRSGCTSEVLSADLLSRAK